MIKCPGCGEENPPKFRLCGYCGTPLAPASAPVRAHEVRKTVTILFCDLKGSTALGEHLDPEALHEVKERYFAAMAEAITRHGGKIEKYIGDAIMAVFGLPRSREDDALRAVRAAAGMQVALAQLNTALLASHGVTLANRTGVNTGEVVANDDPGADQKLATGDAVNVAARLEQAAPENEVYIGDPTYRLVRDAVEAEPVAALELKGKAQRVRAFRLVRVHGTDGLVRRHDRPLVGREADLTLLRRVYAEACVEGVARMVTVIGDAGVGKSRLMHEVIEHVAAGAQVLSGRCLPYGDGITFWPLMSMVRDAAGIQPDDSPERARARVLAGVGDAAIADRLCSAAGLDSTLYPLHEINWAARKFLEQMAARGPVLACIDDIHWAEPALLDLIDHVLQTAQGAPILLLATSRHDLLEGRPDWGTTAESLRLVLRPLSDEASIQVVHNLLGGAGLAPDVMARIVRAAEGNPLYAEQMLSMLVDNGTLQQQDGHWVSVNGTETIAVPPTIQALLEARLDKLSRAERMTVEPASVIGLEFQLPSVSALAPESLRADLPGHLDALSRKQFVRDASLGRADGVYRFHHHLVRETVYNGLLKRTRAQLHLALVRWADQAHPERTLEFEEVMAYHLEQAHRYLGELGALDAEAVAIGEDAARRLANAGRRAATRGDVNAAANLLGRAVALLPAEHSARLALLPELGDALIGIGDFARARSALDDAVALAGQAGNRRVEASALLGRMLVRRYSGDQQGDWSQETLDLAHRLIPALEAEGADNELASAWRSVVIVHGIAGRFAAANDVAIRSIDHARRAGNHRLVVRNAYLLAVNALQGDTPVRQAIAQVEALMAGELGDQQIEGLMACALAQLKAMDGDIGAAQQLMQRSRAMLKDLSQGVFAASSGIDLARVELRGGDLARAEAELRADLEFLVAKGETYLVSTMASLLARLLREQGRGDEALALSRTAEEATADDDVESGALWRMVRAPLLAARGLGADALALAQEAVALAQRTEAPILQADALWELATVQQALGQSAAAGATADQACALYRAKGDRWSAARALPSLSALQ
jgi:class 3 adenylate cyclase